MCGLLCVCSHISLNPLTHAPYTSGLLLLHRYDTLVAGGGDGTLNELVAALLKHDAPSHISIAQLPLGTANDLASAAGISLVSFDTRFGCTGAGWDERVANLYVQQYPGAKQPVSPERLRWLAHNSAPRLVCQPLLLPQAPLNASRLALDPGT
jgi:hypothetical protein